MVSGKYGMDLVNALVPLVERGDDGIYLIKPATAIDKEREKYSLRILPLLYQGGIKPVFTLITSERDQTKLSVMDIGPDGDAEHTIDDLIKEIGKELSPLLTQSFLPLNGDQANELYERLEGARPGTLRGLVAALRHYESIEENVHYERRRPYEPARQGIPFSGRRGNSAIFQGQGLRNRLQRH